MFNATELVIDRFVASLKEAYERNYGTFEPSFGEIIAWAGRMALERIAQTDAFYHTVEHTILVTAVGQEMLRGRHMRQGGVTPRDWLHVIVSLLCHDIGYVRGVCRDDAGRECATGDGDGRVTVPPGATDAFLTPYHVDRGKRFVEERFGRHAILDTAVLVQNIELTRFPTPEKGDDPQIGDYRALVRAADLIGQLADPHYLRKLPALFAEFQETGIAAKLGYASAADLRAGYPRFFWDVVHPFVADGLAHLAVTEEGRQWRANLFAHVFAVEHENR